MAPREEIREKAAKVVGADRFLVVHMSAPVEVCRHRDQEGLYGAADIGEIANFPGVSFAYEPPVKPDLTLDTSQESLDECVAKLLKLLEEKQFVS